MPDFQRIYSLVVDLEPLLETQRHVIQNLGNIYATRRKQFNYIKRELRRFKTEQQKARENIDRYLRNRINNFTFTKRMSFDWSYIKNITKDKTMYKRNKTLKYPTDDDLDEAGRVLLRLQRVYSLNITQLTSGIMETNFSADGRIYKEEFLPMTSSDCYTVGKVIYKNKFYKRSLPWFVQALHVSTVERPAFGINKIDILRAISDVYSKLNDSIRYVEWTRKLLALKPKYDKETIREMEVSADIHELRNYQANLKAQNLNDNFVQSFMPCGLGCKAQKNQKKKKKKKSNGKNVSKYFGKLCRGEWLVGHRISKRLKCWYFTGFHSFTQLAPFRAEQIFLRPLILLIHNAISEKEIEKVKEIALPRLEINPTQYSSNVTTMFIRLAKGMRFDVGMEQSVSQITRRVSDFTGLRAEAQPLTVTNYGVGGHYILHFDSSDYMDRSTVMKKFKNKNIEISPEDADAQLKFMLQFYRTETILFYLSDVVQGGATVFPLLGLTVFPAKGAALVWANLLPSGKADYLMRHGACPVLRGSKWVATKWISGLHQELMKPCTKRNTSRLLQQIPDPVFKHTIYL